MDISYQCSADVFAFVEIDENDILLSCILYLTPKSQVHIYNSVQY